MEIWTVVGSDSFRVLRILERHDRRGTKSFRGLKKLEAYGKSYHLKKCQMQSGRGGAKGSGPGARAVQVGAKVKAAITSTSTASSRSLSAIIPVVSDSLSKYEPQAQAFQAQEENPKIKDAAKTRLLVKFLTAAYRPFRKAVLAPFLPPVNSFCGDIAAHYSRVPESVKTHPDFRSAYLELVKAHHCPYSDSSRGQH
jgi:hypothetical protein